MSKRKSSIDWKKIEQNYLARIQKEIDEGKDPVERYLLEKTPEEIKEIQEVPTAVRAKRRRKSGPQDGQTRVISREQVRKFYDKGFTTGQIAEQLNCSSEQIRRILRDEFKVTPHRDVKRQRRKPKHPYETYVKAYAEAGSYKGAARILGVSDYTVRYALHQSIEAKEARDAQR